MPAEIPDYLLAGYESDEGYMVTSGPVCCGVCHEMIPADTPWYWSKEKMHWDHSTVENPCIDFYEKEFGLAPHAYRYAPSNDAGPVDTTCGDCSQPKDHPCHNPDRSGLGLAKAVHHKRVVPRGWQS